MMTQQQQLMEDILQYWQENKTFQQSLQSRSEHMSYMFYDGPPFPSGDPHYGHLLQSTVKDLIPRWMTMRGYRVNRRRGWDCHGIPAENAVNKELGITSRKQVEEEFGVQNYVEECRKMVNNVNDRRKWFVDHVGRRADMENAYFTMDVSFMEAVIGVFADLYDKNLIYKGFKVLGYSTALGTALSHSEIAEGYEDRQDPAVTIKFKVKGNEASGNSSEKGEFAYTDEGYLEYILGVITDEKGRQLMLHNMKRDGWQFPGGKQDKGETPEQTLIRELKEELGVDVLTTAYVGSRKLVSKNIVWRGNYYHVTIAGEPKIQEPHKHSMMKWVSFEEHENAAGFALNFEGTISAEPEDLKTIFDATAWHQLKQPYAKDMKDAPVSFLAWTTTPWTLPSNMFLAVNPDIIYSILFDVDAKEYFILAKNLVHKFYKNAEEYVLICEVKGKELVGVQYEPLFPYYYTSKRLNPDFQSQVHVVLSADFVTDQDGTGIAHEAPAFGEDDYQLVASVLPRDRAKEWLFNPVDEYGQFTDEVPEWHGRNVIECNADVIKHLKQAGKLVKQETINHSYPHCPRTGLPLIYRAIESWFVKEDELKAKTIPAVDPVHMVPHTVKARFVNGLQSAPDWNISRTRFWGAPLPVWQPENGVGDPLVLGSLDEIYQFSKTGSKNIMRHIFIRHAQGGNNVEKIWDDFAQLTDLGREQAAKAGENLKRYFEGEKPVVIMSPMQRCFQTILPYLSTIYSETEIEEITQEYYKVHDWFEKIDGNIVTYVHDSATQKRFKLYDNVYVDFRILEIMQPSLRGEKEIQVFSYATDKPITQGGESVFDVERRLTAYLEEVTKEFPTQTIVHASHWTPGILFEKLVYNFDYAHSTKHAFKNAERRVYYYDMDRKQGVDLHKPYVDAYWFEVNGVKYKRISEVLDCWFESGSMPYGEYHKVGMPLQSDRKADFIAEGLDQTRGWFRSLHVLSTALQERRTFDNVVVTGMILAEDGKKMSKSKKNYPDPTGLLEQYGADAFRLYVLNSPVVRAEPLRFSEKGVEQVLKDVLIPLENVWKFFATYAQVDQWQHPGTQVWFMRHAHAQETEEVARTQMTPLTEKGIEQLSTHEFRENVHRVQPDIIVVSDFVRAQQTAQKVQDILSTDLGRQVEIVVEEGLGLGGTAEGIGKVYEELTQKYAGKRILVVSHNLRFRYLRAHLFGISGDMSQADMKAKYGIENTQIVPLPLYPILGELDQWLFAELHQLMLDLNEAMQAYYLDTATKILMEFIDKISNWYVRRSRRRFWSEGMSEDKKAGYYTLFEVIRTYLMVMAPFAPFATESLWQQMRAFIAVSADAHAVETAFGAHENDSVHLQYRPLQASSYINHALMEEIATVRKVITGALFLRAKNKIKVKQPLKALRIQV